jgi:uncharacterized protein (TIGR02646 family)
MRPVRRNNSPITGEFAKYEDAKPELVSRLGLFCSYCERKISTLLAVEHIEPKDKAPALEKVWSNFLLACVNCNSCKSSKTVIFNELLFPDRDNTFHSYIYLDDGTITVNPMLSAQQRKQAQDTLKLVGLDKPMQKYSNSNDEVVALDRSGQRMEAIATAQQSLGLLETSPEVEALKQSIVISAKEAGFFSIWMKVFNAHPHMKILFIKAFKGTEDSGCFNMQTGAPITPAPNLDNLLDGGKV